MAGSIGTRTDLFICYAGIYYAGRKDNKVYHSKYGEKKTLETAGPDKYHLCREDCCSGLLNEAFYSNCDQSDQPPIHCLCASATHHKGPHILSLNDNQPFYGTIWNLKKKNLCAYPV